MPRNWCKWTSPTPADPRANRLFQCLREIIMMSGAGLRRYGSHRNLKFIQTRVGKTTLFLRPNPVKSRLDWGIGGDERHVEAERANWIRMLEAAEALLRKVPIPRWYWAAILIPDPHQPGSHDIRLKESVKLGNVDIADGNSWIDKPAAGLSPSVVGGSWPLVASGAIDVHQRGIAEDQAHRTIREICALLSLAWSSCIGYERWEPVILQGVSSEKDAPLDDACHKLTEAARQSTARSTLVRERYLPGWAVQAWSQLSKREGAALVGAYTEGIKQFYAGQHSAASVFFHSVLDTLGRGEGALGRVKWSINKVLGSNSWEMARQIANETYSARSDIAHAGLLLGYETQLGMRSCTTSVMPDPTYEFVVRVDFIRRICRARLLQHFRARPEQSSPSLIEHWHDIKKGAVFMGPGL